MVRLSLFICFNNQTRLSASQSPWYQAMNQICSPSHPRKQIGVKKYKNYKKAVHRRKPEVETNMLNNFYLLEEEMVEKAKEVLMMESTTNQCKGTDPDQGWDHIELGLKVDSKIEGWGKDAPIQESKLRQKNKEVGVQQPHFNTGKELVKNLQQKSFLLNHNTSSSPFSIHRSTKGNNNTKSSVKANVVVISNLSTGFSHRKFSTNTNFSSTNCENTSSGHIFKIKERIEKNKNINSVQKHTMFDSRVFKQRCTPLHSFSQVEIDRRPSVSASKFNTEYKRSEQEGIFKHRHTRSENYEHSVNKYIALHTFSKKPMKVAPGQKQDSELTNLRKLYQLVHSFNYRKHGDREAERKGNTKSRILGEKKYKSRDTESRTYCIKEMVCNYINKQTAENGEENKIGDLLGRNRKLSVRTVKQPSEDTNAADCRKWADRSLHKLGLVEPPLKIKLHTQFSFDAVRH